MACQINFQQWFCGHGESDEKKLFQICMGNGRPVIQNDVKLPGQKGIAWKYENLTESFMFELIGHHQTFEKCFLAMRYCFNY